MNHLDEALRRAAADLSATGASFAVVGGLAVSVRGEPRLTRDVDLAVAVVSDPEAEAIVRGLLQQGYRVLAQLEQEPTRRLATVRLASPHPGSLGAVVDLLFAASGIEIETVAEASSLEVLPGLVLPVAARPHLVAMKVLAFDARRRPQDWDDVRSMVERSTPEEMVRVHDLLGSIERRGFARGRDLRARLDAMLEP